jgi:nucleoid-associated protein YgaU
VIWTIAQNGVTARLRQDCVVNLLQYVADDRLALKNIAVGQAPGSGPSKTGWPKHYTVATGDTLQKIAAKFYKDSGKWSKIATANHIRDGSKLTKGTKLIIPAP